MGAEWLRAMAGVCLLIIGLPIILIGVIASFIGDMFMQGFKLYVEWTR